MQNNKKIVERTKSIKREWARQKEGIIWVKSVLYECVI